MPLSVTLGGIDNQPANGRIVVLYNNSANTGGWNRLLRSTPSENGGTPIKIGDPVPLFHHLSDFAEFHDYNVASGKSYIYSWEVSDGSMVVGTSDSDSGIITLSSAWLHVAHKNHMEDVTTPTNGELAMRLIDFAPYQQSRKLTTISRNIANSTKPRVGVGSIKHTQVNPSFLITYDNDNRATLRSIFKSNYYVCLRDTFGNKYFGRLIAPTENYGATFTTPTLLFESLSFDESVG